MRYWVSELSFTASVLGVALFGLGLVLMVSGTGAQVSFYALAIMSELIAVYGVIRRRVAVRRFKSVFGFMPSPEEHDERFRHLVVEQVRSCAVALQAAYHDLDEKRAARERAADSVAADSLQRDYERGRKIARSYSRMFYGAIDAATSGWLPHPYQKISRNLTDWVG